MRVGSLLMLRLAGIRRRIDVDDRARQERKVVKLVLDLVRSVGRIKGQNQVPAMAVPGCGVTVDR